MTVEPGWLITFNGKPQYVVGDELTAMRIEADLLKLGERRETLDLELHKLPSFTLEDAGPWLQTYHRATKTLFADTARRHTPNLHSWEKIRPSAHLTHEEIQCNRRGGLWSEVTHSNKDTGPNCHITVVGFSPDDVSKLFNYEAAKAHEVMKNARTD